MSSPIRGKASGNIICSRLVSLTSAADFTFIQATANLEAFGVAYEGSNYPPLSDLVSTNYAASDGEEFRIYGPGTECLVEAGNTITRGVKCKSDSVGRAIPIEVAGATRQYYAGWALESATAAGQKVRFWVQPGESYPALS